MLNALDVLDNTFGKMKSVPSLWNDFLLDDILKPISSAAEKSITWPAVDVCEFKDRYSITADVPGMTEKDIQIRVENGNLVIEGERKSEHEDSKEGKLLSRERTHTRFKKSFTLGEGINIEKIEAQYKNGVLTIHLPKNEQVLPKVIPISIQAK